MSATLAEDSRRRSALPRTPERLPLLTLGLLAGIGFALIAMETMPAGLLPEMASGLRTDERVIGLFVSASALGTTVRTVPAIALTRRIPRKPLLSVVIGCLVVANSVTAFS